MLHNLRKATALSSAPTVVTGVGIRQVSLARDVLLKNLRPLSAQAHSRARSPESPPRMRRHYRMESISRVLEVDQTYQQDSLPGDLYRILGPSAALRIRSSRDRGLRPPFSFNTAAACETYGGQGVRIR